MRKFLIILFLLSLACGKGGEFLKGSSRDIVLVYSEDSKYSAGAIYKYFLKVYSTPQPETLFKVHPIRWDKFEIYKDYRNKIVLILPSDSLWSLCNEEEGFFVRKDIFMNGDFVIMLCSYDSRGLLRIVSDNLQTMFDSILSKSLREISKIELIAGVDMKLRKKVKDKFGFLMPIPEGWKVFVERKNLLVINKHNPDRFIIFFSRMGVEELSLNRILDIRDSIAGDIYNGDVVVRDHVYTAGSNIDGISILKIYGIWKNDSLMVGGPFVIYAFNKDNRFYMLDAGVYAPESDNKLGLILRMEGLFRKIEW